MAAKKSYITPILTYLLEHKNEDVSRSDLIENFHISVSRLSEVLRDIRGLGYTIESPNRSGIVRLVVETEEEVMMPMDASVVRQWVILLLLSCHEEISFKDLVKEEILLRDPSFEFLGYEDTGYDDGAITGYLRGVLSGLLEKEESSVDVAGELISVPTLRKDLHSLCEDGLVKMNTYGEGPIVSATYSLTPKAPLLIQTSEDRLIDFCNACESKRAGMSGTAPLQSAYQKAFQLLNGFNEENHLRFTGRVNHISPAQIKAYNYFISFPYPDHILLLKTAGEEGLAFRTGLIYYSTETDCFYTLGKDLDKDRIVSIRLDSLQEITVSDRDVKHSHSDEKREYQIRLNQMFASGYEERLHTVKVLVQDSGNVIAQFKKLKSLRKATGASLSPIESKPEDEDFIYDYVYEDRVRGLADFARYLRSFGYSVLAVEPPELARQMADSATRKLAKYEEFSKNV